jgi:peptidoglycan hydrolase-like protein with peptidoglycan-binding domain
MRVGSKGENVRKLQEVLIYEGLLKIKAPTGEFWGYTRDAVKKLQEKYKSEILTPLGLKYPTGIVGKSTLAFLNKKYE